MSATPEYPPRLTPSQRKAAAKARLEELVKQETTERHSREAAEPPVTNLPLDRWERRQLFEDRERAYQKWYKEFGISPPTISDPSKPRPARTPDWVGPVQRALENTPMEGKGQKWGFVSYWMAECDVAEWELAKEKILHGAINGLKAPDDFVALKDGAWLQWIDDGDFRTEGRDLDALRTHFRSFRTTEAFVPGMLRDIFLVIDSESLRSIMSTDEKDKSESFVIAVDAQYGVTEKLPLSSAGPKPTPRDYSLASGWTTKYNYPDFPGYLKFDLDLIFSVLYPELVRSAPLDKYWTFDEDWQTFMNLSSSQKEQVGI